MIENDIFKEKLENYASPLSERVSFEKVMAKTNSKAMPIWSRPKFVVSMGLFLVAGAGILGYYSQLTSASDNASSNLVKVENNMTSNDNEQVAANNDAEAHLMPQVNSNEDLSRNLKIVAKTNIGESDVKTNNYIELKKQSYNDTKSVVANANVIPNTSGIEFNPIGINKVESNIEIVSKKTINKGEVSYTKDEINIGLADESTEILNADNTNGDLNTRADANTITQVDKNEPMDGSKVQTPTKTSLDKDGEGPGFSKNWGLETTVFSSESTIYGTPTENEEIAGSQRSFNLNALAYVNLSQKWQIAGGIAYTMGENNGRYNALNEFKTETITPRTIVIIQPGLPNQTLTVYDTSRTSQIQKTSTELSMQTRMLAIPLSVRYKIKNVQEFDFYVNLTTQPGLYTRANGHAFNSQEYSNNNTLSNVFVIQNSLGFRVAYELGKEWKFVFEPTVNHTMTGNSSLNLNKKLKYGMGVGIMFQL
jgi:hypothetical protein